MAQKQHFEQPALAFIANCLLHFSFLALLLQLRHMHKADPEAAEEVEERDHIFSTPPVFKAPYYPIAILCERDVILHAIVALLLFGSMFCSITELPLYLSAPPYNLSAAMIGECVTALVSANCTPGIPVTAQRGIDSRARA
jgi:hypothetical protein